MHISTVNISKMVTDKASITIAIKYELHIGMRPWLMLQVKVKVMHISTANISQIVTDRADITIAIKYNVTSGFSIIILKFDIGVY